MEKKKYLKGLKKKMRKGDRKLIAHIVDCSEFTVDDALEGKEGKKRDDVITELDRIISERDRKKEELNKKYSKS